LQPLDENARSSVRCNFDHVSNVSDISDLQSEKHDLHNISTLAGMIILCRPLDENADSSIRCNFDPVSNEKVVIEHIGESESSCTRLQQARS
jgi:hypothetical protein